MKLRVYSNSAFLLRAAIGFSRRVTSAGEDSYSFSLNSIFCRTSCTCSDLIARPDSFRKEIPHPRFFYCHAPSKNEGNLEHASPDDTVDAVDPKQVSDLPAGKDVLQHRIVIGSQKGKWRHQCTDARAGHDAEARPAAAVGPAAQKSSAKGAFRTTAGQRQHRQRRGRGIEAQQRLARIISPGANVGHAGNPDIGIVDLAIGLADGGASSA